MATLWEMLTRNKVQPVKEVPNELKVYNPLKAQINNHVAIKTVDLEDIHFHVSAVREIKREANGDINSICDLNLVATPLGGETIRKRIRLVPMDKPDSQFTHDVILLNLVAEFGYDKDYHEGLKFENNNGEAMEPVVDEQGNAVMDGEEQVFDKFWRVNDLKTPWEARTAFLADEDNSGKVDDDEVKRGTLTYWDFWRDTTDDDGNKITEFYIVEMDDAGYFEVWRGSSIDPSRVSVN